MAVTVEPASFSYVAFEAADIVAGTERMLALIGLPPETPVQIVVDERVPLSRARLTATDPITIEAESGAFEDRRRPRQLADEAVADTVGRLLFQARDRLDPAFGSIPPDAELTPEQLVAWDTFCVARLHRLGERAQKQRRLYTFRLRHGFTDEADAAFEQLWTLDDLTWGDVVALSDRALAARDAVASA